SAASSALPTRTPATSVMRLRDGTRAFLVYGRTEGREDADEMALGCRNRVGVNESGAMVWRELLERPNQDRAPLFARPRRLAAKRRRNVELVARSRAARQRHDGIGGEHVDVVAGGLVAPILRPRRQRGHDGDFDRRVGIGPSTGIVVGFIQRT